jgi:Fic family protein
MNFPISARTASRELEELYKKGVIEKKGKGPAVYYLLARFGEIRVEKRKTS